jgi:hypothetical protein
MPIKENISIKNKRIKKLNKNVEGIPLIGNLGLNK